MNTQISSKIAALVVALTLNTMIVAGVALMFDMQSRGRTAAQSQTIAVRPSMYALA